MRVAHRLFVAVATLYATSACAQPAPTRVACTVRTVSDGDTLRCAEGNRVRLLLIDAPERDQEPFGQQARAALLALAPIGSVLYLEYDVQPRDQFGRTLAYVFDAKGLMINDAIVRAGWAEVLVYAPNVRYVERIRGARDEARAAKRGLWATNGFDCTPRDHRAGRCGPPIRARTLR